jgi:predicted patatin/cPLA2 family phospholipase
VVSQGTGRYSATLLRNDVQPSYNLDTTNDWYVLAKATDASALVELANQKLMYGTMPDALRTEIKTAVQSITLSATPTESQVRNRLWAAMLLTVASPEFMIQK